MMRHILFAYMKQVWLHLSTAPGKYTRFRAATSLTKYNSWMQLTDSNSHLELEDDNVPLHPPSPSKCLHHDKASC